MSHDIFEKMKHNYSMHNCFFNEMVSRKYTPEVVKSAHVTGKVGVFWLETWTSVDWKDARCRSWYKSADEKPQFDGFL